MPANKNALIRYKTIDNCIRNTSHSEPHASRAIT